MMNNKLWTRKQLKEMNLGESKYNKMVEAVDKYIAEKMVERVNIWVNKVSTKRLTREQKILFYYNSLATPEENFLKGLAEYSWTGQISELEFLATTPELKDKFVSDFLGKKGYGILCDIGDFRKYIREELGRGKGITYEVLNACINYDDLKNSDWYKLNDLMQELYLKPCHVVNMELIYDGLMKGYTMQDIWAWYKLEPLHMFKFRMFNFEYSKNKAAKQLGLPLPYEEPKYEYKKHNVFVIVDSNGRYCDEHSIWRDTEEKKWKYSSWDSFTNGMWLSSTFEQAQSKLDKLIALLPKVNMQDMVFTIKEESI